MSSVDAENIEKIRTIIDGVIHYKKEIILFGSQTTGNKSNGSDYDILVIVDAPDDVSRKDLVLLGSMVRRKCAKIGIDIDILVRDREYVEQLVAFQGNVISEAVKYGITIH